MGDRNEWAENAAAVATVLDVRGYLRGAVRGRPADGTLAREVDDHLRHAVLWALIRVGLIVVGALLMIVAFIRPAEAQSIPSSATGVYATQNDAPWTCLHEFGQLDNGRRYWRPACIRTPGLTPYVAHYIVWQWPADCPKVGAQVPMWEPGDLTWPPDYFIRIDAYASGALALSITPVDSTQSSVQILSMQAIQLQPPIPYSGCGASSARVDRRGW